MDYYRYLESSFVDITRLVPLENKPNTFSPRLYEILQGTCSQVESVLKIMCRELNIAPERKSKSKPHETTSSDSDDCLRAEEREYNFKPYEALNHDGAISCQEVVSLIRTGWHPMKPFVCDFNCGSNNKSEHKHHNVDNSKMPQWWRAYNKSKHNLPKEYKVGSIENAYLALAGLYVLHFMAHMLVVKRKDFLKQDFWHQHEPLKFDSYHRHYQKEWVEPKSDIFYPIGHFSPPRA